MMHFYTVDQHIEFAAFHYVERGGFFVLVACLTVIRKFAICCIMFLVSNHMKFKKKSFLNALESEIYFFFVGFKLNLKTILFFRSGFKLKME